MFEITVNRRFAAAHRIEGHRGRCAGLHGHTWTVEVTVGGRQLDHCGMLVDFKTIKDVVDGIIRHLDHAYLNELEYFGGVAGKKNPTAENLAEYIYFRVKEELSGIASEASPFSVRIWESPDASALYRED